MNGIGVLIRVLSGNPYRKPPGAPNSEGGQYTTATGVNLVGTSKHPSGAKDYKPKEVVTHLGRKFVVDYYTSYDELMKRPGMVRMAINLRNKGYRGMIGLKYADGGDKVHPGYVKKNGQLQLELDADLKQGNQTMAHIRKLIGSR